MDLLYRLTAINMFSSESSWWILALTSLLNAIKNSTTVRPPSPPSTDRFAAIFFYLPFLLIKYASSKSIANSTSLYLAGHRGSTSRRLYMRHVCSLREHNCTVECASGSSLIAVSTVSAKLCPLVLLSFCSIISKHQTMEGKASLLSYWGEQASREMRKGKNGKNWVRQLLLKTFLLSLFRGLIPSYCELSLPHHRLSLSRSRHYIHDSHNTF